MLDAATVEVDDAYIGARGGSAGRGTSQQALIVAVDRAPAGKGSCVVRVAEDCSGGSYRQFGHDHLCHASTIRTDGWAGSAAGLAGFGIVQKRHGADGQDSSLPMVHKVISNFKAYVGGTFHGLAAAHMQAYADAFCWRYNHRMSASPAADLLEEVCIMHVPRGDIPGMAAIQPKMEAGQQRVV